jgi:hypothetical protein
MKAEKQAIPEKVVCRDCGMVFTAKGQYKRVSEGKSICRDGPSCRQRVLSATLGIDLFTRYPRERTFFEMDTRPPGRNKTGPWEPLHSRDAGWQALHSEDERVMAAWIYYSWCYPVGLPYAVQIDADDELMHDRYGQPMPMTQERLAQILGIHQPNLVRATRRLEARKMLRLDEDGKVYPTAKPAISAAERAAAGVVDNAAELGEAPNTVPRQYRHLLNDLLRDAPEDIRTDMRGKVLASCTTFNVALVHIRTERDSSIEQVCIELASLLSRHLEFRKHAGVSSCSGTIGPRASQAPVDANRETPDKLVYSPPGPTPASVLYEAIPTWQKRYPKSAFASRRFNSLGKADRQLTQRIVAALDGADATDFVAYVDELFRPEREGGRGRSPYDSGGPKTPALLIEWAGDFARLAPEILAERQKAEAETKRQDDIAARRASAEATLETRRETLLTGETPWAAICRYLRGQTTRVNFNNWLLDTEHIRVDGHILFIQVPDEETKAWISTEFNGHVHDAIAHLGLPISHVEYSVRERAARAAAGGAS